jgi:hypothetical protein
MRGTFDPERDLSLAEDVMGFYPNILRYGVLAAVLFSTSFPALAEQNTPRSSTDCFFMSQWKRGWWAPTPDTIYIGLNSHEIYRVGLSSANQKLQWPDVHLITLVREGDTVCSPLDLQLRLVFHGIPEPLIPTSITKLTPDEIASLPLSFRL